MESQYWSMADAVRYSIPAREEDLNPTDDANIRAYYKEGAAGWAVLRRIPTPRSKRRP